MNGIAKTVTTVCLAILGLSLSGLGASDPQGDLPAILSVLDLPTKPDAKLVSQYFKQAEEKRFTLSTESKELAAPARHALSWLIQELHGSAATKGRHYSFRLSRTKRGTEHDYEIHRVAAMNPAAIDSGKYYIQVQYFPHVGLACPEFHAVIDLDVPKVISHWSEGA